MDAEQVIAQALANEPGSGGGIPAGPYQVGLAKAALAALTAAGFAVMAPQDLEWGECPGSESGHHYVSLSLCSGCLEYDPD